MHASDWRRSNAFYGDVLGAEVVRAGAGWSYRFGDQQPNLHGPGVDTEPVARIPVPPGGSYLCFVRPGVSDAEQHLRRHGVEVEMGPVERRGAGGVSKSVYFRDPTARSWNSSRIRRRRTYDRRGAHVRKGMGVPVS